MKLESTVECKFPWDHTFHVVLVDSFGGRRKDVVSESWLNYHIPAWRSSLMKLEYVAKCVTNEVVYLVAWTHNGCVFSSYANEVWLDATFPDWREDMTANTVLRKTCYEIDIEL